MAKKKQPKNDPGKTEAMVTADDSWKQESDFRTLTEAQEIRDDPDRLKKAMKFGKSKIKKMRSVTDLIDYRNAKYGPGGMDDDDGDE